jgi:hypothetical protein
MSRILRDVLFIVPSVPVLAAVGYVALKYPNSWWAAGFSTFAVSSILLAILLAQFRHGATRAFAAGFAVFGGAYFVLVSLPTAGELRSQLVTTKLLDQIYLLWNPPPQDPANDTFIALSAPPGKPGAAMLTSSNPAPTSMSFTVGSPAPSGTPASVPTITSSPASSSVSLRIGSPAPTGMPSPSPAVARSPAPGGADLALFDRIGQSLATLYFALLGGLSGRLLHATRDEDEAVT